MSAKPRLDKYRQMRRPGATPEPFGGGAGRRGMFCVQKHAATRLHYDFRLELGGTLRSWAVPRGPSRDPAEKRMAIEVEDHPVEYGDFEGIIPAGNYGAGAVILWDRGTWTPLEDPEEGFVKGKLLFELHGWKLHGVWQLVRTKGQNTKKGEVSREWLLIKKPDAWASAKEGSSYPQESILSGLTVEELGAGRDPAAEIRAELERLGAPRRAVDPAKISPMLAEIRDAPFDDPGWLFELKHDGYRLIAARDGSHIQLRYRSGIDATGTWPDLAAAIGALPHPQLIADGEVVVLDERGVGSFQLLQQRAQIRRAIDVGRAAGELPATLFLFDLIAYGGHDLRGLPLATRKALLRRIIPPLGPIRFSDHIEGQGQAFYEAVRERKLEGIIAKKADSIYRMGRHPDWLKIKVPQIDPFVIIGYAPGERSRAEFGAVHLGAYDPAGRLIYAGRAGSGFTAAQIDSLRPRLDAMRLDAPPFVEGTPYGKGHTWCRPELVCEVRYAEWTNDRVIRQPVFLRLREDLKPEDCLITDPARLEPTTAVPVEPAPPERVVQESNRDKIFWPDEGYTKGDLLDHYRAIAPAILPYLRDRPVMLTRYPDGIKGKSFFQKDAPGFVPGWLRTERMYNEDARREVDQFICDDLESLIYLINLGTIPLHIWSSRAQSIGRADWCVLDLDPKEAPFTDVIKVARAIHELCDEIGIEPFIKTSGSSGLHILLPLGAQLTHDQSKSLGELIARVIADQLPEIATTVRLPANRGGRVYIDFLQNGHGKLIAAPWAARPVAGAKVSTPLEWSEVTARLDPGKFTIKTAAARFAKVGDPMAPVLAQAPDLGGVLTKLDEKLRSRS